jgi:hypothetical protein
LDGQRFDEFVKVFASTATRRNIVRRFFGAASGLAISGQLWDSSAASCRDAGVTCNQDANCCTGHCGPKDARGRRRCGCPDTETEHACGSFCCPTSVACNPDGGCCVGPGDVPEGGRCRLDSECCGGVCNDYARYCYDGCIPAGGYVFNINACCRPLRAYSAEDIGRRYICAECVPDGRIPSSPSAIHCCSGNLDQQTNRCVDAGTI